MKKNKTLIIYLSVILFAPLSLTQSEEYDESFLESLPEEVREDLLERKKNPERIAKNLNTEDHPHLLISLKILRILIGLE